MRWQSPTRRTFLRSGIAAAVLARAARPLHAFPLGLPPGLQLWSIRADLSRNESATLAQISKIGYRELEHYEMPRSPAAFRRKCDDSGLKLVSAHFDMPPSQFGSPRTIEGAAKMGLAYMVIVFPTLRSLSGPNAPHLSWKELNLRYEKISIDDYKWNAEQFNLLGERVKKAGMQLAYHNHAIDLRKLEGGARGFDTLLRLTDPNLVVFEMDCGHVIHAGADPIAYLQNYPTRIRLLHIKDLKAGYSVSASLDTEDQDTNAEIGAGVIDWKRLFGVIQPGTVRHWFVEHEGKMDHPPLESIAITYNYLARM